MLNEKLNQIYRNIASSKVITKNLNSSQKKDTEDFKEERDSVNNLKSTFKRINFQDTNSLPEASYIKSCESQSLKLLHKSTLKFKIKGIQKLSKKINDSIIEYDENFAKENFELENENETKVYEILEVN